MSEEGIDYHCHVADLECNALCGQYSKAPNWWLQSVGMNVVGREEAVRIGPIRKLLE